MSDRPMCLVRWSGQSSFADVVPGTQLRIGRQGDLALAPADPGLSRIAALVSPTDDGWRVEIRNANGGSVHPWGLAVPTGRITVTAWPRVAIRLSSSAADRAHWVLLETRLYPFPDATAQPRKAGPATDMADVPLVLTPTEEKVLRTVFEPQLAWPPSLDPPRQLKQAARRLSVTETAVQKSLARARAKADRLGLARHVELTQPDYLHVLVAAGYLRWKDDGPPRNHL
ncbi:MAG: hypothetical protein ACRDRX_25560 [Pseudonocardiaceae bacterium]